MIHQVYYCYLASYHHLICLPTPPSETLFSWLPCCHTLAFFFFFPFLSEGSEAWLKAMESFLPATGFLYWVGAGTVAYLALHILCLLFTAVRVWGLGNESGVGPRLGEWAGESNSAPPSP